MAELVVRGASVLTGTGWAERDLAASDGVVVEEASPEAEVVDGSGLLAVPGFVDLQCNGAMGIDLTSEPERLWELAAFLPRWGVTAWLPTIITSPVDTVARARAAITRGAPGVWEGAWPIGLHLEGPFLNPDRRGAHPASLIRPPDPAALHGWRPDGGVALVTLAPELPGAMEVIDALVGEGVVVALGHSAATAAETRAALDRGATWVTHVFNAMSPLGHREPGLPGVALVDDRVSVGIVADGIHVDPTVVDLALRAAGERLTLVTDAVSALGLPPGRHRLGSATVEVGPDGVRLPDGTLAGSNLSMDAAVRNLVAFTGCPPEVALRAASTTPARVLGDDTRGRLIPGARADLVLLSPDLEVVATYVAGREVFHRERLQA